MSNQPTLKSLQRELNITLAKFDSQINNGFNDQVAINLGKRAQQLQEAIDFKIFYGK